MLEFIILKGSTPTENHLGGEDPRKEFIGFLTVDKNIDSFSSHYFYPEDALNSDIPNEFRAITPEKLKELKETGETRFSYMQTVTVIVKEK